MHEDARLSQTNSIGFFSTRHSIEMDLLRHRHLQILIGSVQINATTRYLIVFIHRWQCEAINLRIVYI